MTQLALDLFAVPAPITAPPITYSLAPGGPPCILLGDGLPCIADPIVSLGCAEAAVRALNTVRS